MQQHPMQQHPSPAFGSTIPSHYGSGQPRGAEKYSNRRAIKCTELDKVMIAVLFMFRRSYLNGGTILWARLNDPNGRPQDLVVRRAASLFYPGIDWASCRLDTDQIKAFFASNNKMFSAESGNSNVAKLEAQGVNGAALYALASNFSGDMIIQAMNSAMDGEFDCERDFGITENLLLLESNARRAVAEQAKQDIQRIRDADMSASLGNIVENRKLYVLPVNIFFIPRRLRLLLWFVIYYSAEKIGLQNHKISKILDENKTTPYGSDEWGESPSDEPLGSLGKSAFTGALMGSAKGPPRAVLGFGTDAPNEPMGGFPARGSVDGVRFPQPEKPRYTGKYEKLIAEQEHGLKQLEETKSTLECKVLSLHDQSKPAVLFNTATELARIWSDVGAVDLKCSDSGKQKSDQTALKFMFDMFKDSYPNLRDATSGIAAVVATSKSAFTPGLELTAGDMERIIERQGGDEKSKDLEFHYSQILCAPNVKVDEKMLSSEQSTEELLSEIITHEYDPSQAISCCQLNGGCGAGKEKAKEIEPLLNEIQKSQLALDEIEQLLEEIKTITEQEHRLRSKFSISIESEDKPAEFLADMRAVDDYMHRERSGTQSQAQDRLGPRDAAYKEMFTQGILTPDGDTARAKKAAQMQHLSAMWTASDGSAQLDAGRLGARGLPVNGNELGRSAPRHNSTIRSEIAEKAKAHQGYQGPATSLPTHALQMQMAASVHVGKEVAAAKIGMQDQITQGMQTHKRSVSGQPVRAVKVFLCMLLLVIHALLYAHGPGISPSQWRIPELFGHKVY